MSRKWIKRIAVFLGSLILLAVILILFLHTTWGRSIVRKKVESYLRAQLSTTVNIGNIDYRLPNWIELKDVLILDLNKDTLLKGGTLHAEIDMLKLLSQDVKVGGIMLENISINFIRATADSSFNYQFLLDAFVSPSTEPKDTTSNPIQLSIDKISFKNVVFNFSDKNQKQYIRATIGDFFSAPANLEPGKSVYAIKELVTSRCSIAIVDSSSGLATPTIPEAIPVTSRGFNPLLLAIQHLGLKDIRFTYSKPADKMAMELVMDTIGIRNASIDLVQQTIAGNKLTLENTSFTASVWLPGRPAEQVDDYVAERISEKNWKISVDTIALRNNSCVYNNTAMPTAPGVDYNHLDIKNIYLATRNNKIDGSDLIAYVDSCSFTLNKDMQVKNVRSAISFKGNVLVLKDAAIAFNQSAINTSGDLVIPFTTEGPISNTSWNLQHSVISYRDILLLQPDLVRQLPVQFSNTEKITISAQCHGTSNQFMAKNLVIHTSNNTLLFAGDIEYRPLGGTEGITYAATIRQMQVQKSILSPVLQRQLAKSQINLPASIALNGSLTGTKNKLVTNIKVNSSYGQANLKGTINNISQPQRMEYDLLFDGQNMETGKWMNLEKSFGPMTGSVKIKGKGISINNTHATGDIALHSIRINGYNYTNVDVDGEMQGDNFYVKGTIDDPELAIKMNVTGKMDAKYPLMDGLVVVEKANLHALKFSSESMIVSGAIRFDSINTNPENLSGIINVDSSRLSMNGRQFGVDSIFIKGHSTASGSDVSMSSPFFNGNLQSGTSLLLVQANLPRYITHLIQRDSSSTIPLDNSSWVSINASLLPHEIYKAFVPGLELFSPLTIQGRYDGNKQDSSLNLQIKSPSVKYRTYQSDQLDIIAASSNKMLQLYVDADRLLIGPDTLYKPSVKGTLNQDSLVLALNMNDEKGNLFYSAKASLRQEDSTTYIRLLDDVTINRNKWIVPESNWLAMNPVGYIINNVSLQNGSQSISINSQSDKYISPIDIRVENVDIGSLLAFTAMDNTSIAEGKINAAISIQQPIKKIPVFTGNVDIRNLAIQQIPVGDLRFNSHMVGDSLVMEGNLAGNNQLAFAGNLQTRNRNIDLRATLGKLETRLIQELAKEYISRLSGNINGEIHLQGAMDNPGIKGFVHFDTVAFAIKDLEAIYRIQDQDIKLEYPNILFNEFQISDSLGRRIEINGEAKMISFSEYGLNLGVKTKNFIVLNAKRNRQSPIYGTGSVDADLKITGTSNDPIIAGNAFLLAKSNIHYILPQSNDYTNEGKTLIRFVDIDTMPLPITAIKQTEKDSLVKKRSSFGLQYNLNLEVSRDAEFSIIIDPSTNDELVIKGDAQLNIGLEENGSMGLTGIYKLQSGFYNMNNQFLKGKFLLAKGSTITFNGDPYNAEADVTTEYDVKASASGLLGTDETETPGISKRLPFLIIFTIKGPLSKPELAFDIRLKSDATGISGSLKSEVEVELDILRRDVSLLNQQVFSLLVMNQFTVNSGKNNDYLDFDADLAVKDGMSKFLSEAMNQVADDLIKGMDVDVNMKNYKDQGSSETKTDIDVAISKDLFSERMTVTIGKNFTTGETGTHTTDENNAQQYIPDITSTYKLSKDGRYLVKAYRKNDYDAVVEGYFAETGVSFTIEMEYNRFKEIFQRKKKLENQ